MKRNEFKALVKECLKEILADGLGSVSLIESREKKQSPNRTREDLLREQLMAQQRARHPGLDSIPTNPHALLASRMQVSAPPPQQTSARSVIENSVARLSADPTMQALLADTAMTTYAQQPTNPMGQSGVERNVPQTDIPLEQLSGFFGNSMKPSTWETLAFSDKKN